MPARKRRWPRYLTALLVATLLFIPERVEGVLTGDLQTQVIGESLPDAANRLPTAERDVERLTPRQYLFLFHPENAEEIDRIITAESNWNPNAKNKISTASGLCQFVNLTWLETARRRGLSSEIDLSHKLDPYINIDMCVWLYRTDGSIHWEASRHVWSRL